MKQELYAAIRRSGRAIIDLGERIYRNPETGFKEYGTAGIVAEAFAGLPLVQQKFTDIPGLKLTLDTGRPGPGVAILGELDAVTCPSHADADPETGAVHACGHNIQVAALYGAAIGLIQSGIIDQLCGKIHFLAVPAEEYIEIAYRKQLIKEGVLSFLGGKAELVSRGWFDDVDLCLMVHAMPAGTAGNAKVAFQSFNGCVVKEVRFIGKAAHAGAAPQDGINALYAANTALTAMNGLRETFREADCIRIHPIMTKGGDVLNVIPDDVRLETFVRGRTFAAILQAARQFDRAMAGGALALGCSVMIEDLPGAFPLHNDIGLVAVMQSVLEDLVAEHEVADIGHTTASTDLGDLSTIMPVVQPLVGGVTGGLHEASYRIVDPDLAYLVSAELLAGTAAALLAGKAEKAVRIIRDYKPLFQSRQEYLTHLRSLFRTKTYPNRDWEVD